MARKSKDDKAKAASAKGRSTSGAKGAKIKRAKPVKKAMVIKEKAAKTKAAKKSLGSTKAPKFADSSPQAKHGRRYLKAKTKISPDKLYSPAEAVQLVKATNLARFEAKVDLHLNLKDAKFKKEVALPHPLDAKNAKVLLKSEKKTPLLHTSIGTVKDKDEDLLANLKAVLAAFGHGMILKATLTSSMGPGVKVDFTQ